MQSKSQVAARGLPIRFGLSAAEAALAFDLGETKFRELVKQGRAPRPRVIDGRHVWDVDDLRAWFKSLPVEGGADADSWSDL